jgi:hypothetical protein
LLSNLLSRQSMLFPFRICIHVFLFTRSNAFCQSMNQAYNSSSMFKVVSDIILSIPIASLFLFPTDILQKHPQFYFHSFFYVFSLLLCWMFNETDCAIFGLFCSSWHFP